MLWLAMPALAVGAGAARPRPVPRLGSGPRAVPPQAKTTWTLEAVLKQLDAESKSFRSLTANLERIKVTAVVNDRSVESGRIFVRRDDKMLIELTQPDARTVLRNGDRLYLFNPRLKRVEEYNLRNYGALVDQFLLLGFGSSGGNLKKGYLITLMEEEPLDNRKTLLLELTPKSEKVRNQIAKIHLWVDEATWLPVQQKFFETGSGDYFVFHYTNIVRNPRILDSQFKANWPRGVTRIKPQG